MLANKHMPVPSRVVHTPSVTMKELKLHSFGQNDHLESLKKKYATLEQKLRQNKKLSAPEKETALNTLRKSFKEEKKDSSSMY